MRYLCAYYEGKTAGEEIKYDFFEVFNKEKNCWYPTAVAKTLSQKMQKKWKEQGAAFDEITKQDYQNYHQKIDHLP